MRLAIPRLDFTRAYILAVGALIVVSAGAIAKTVYDLRRTRGGLWAALPGPGASGKVDKVARLCRVVRENEKIVGKDDLAKEGETEGALQKYIEKKAKDQGIDPGNDFEVNKGLTDSTHTIYEQFTVTLKWRVEISRKKLLAFLYDLETGAVRLRVTGITLPEVGKPEDRTDSWKPNVQLTYRARKDKPAPTP
jgi:hypothetical protein